MGAAPPPQGAVAGVALAALGGVYLGALWIQAAVYLPKEVVVLLFLGTVTAFRQLRPFLRDWVPLLLLLFAMDVLRAAAYRLTLAVGRPVIVRWPIVVDTALFGTLPSAWLQGWLHPTAEFRWYDVAMAALHGSHFAAFLVVLLLLWAWRREAFPGFARAVVATAYAGLLGYYLFPMAPPWLAAQLGEGPALTRILLSVDYLQIPRFLLLGFDTNPVAAMPSLHAAFAVLVALGLGLLTPWARWVGWMYAVTLGLGLVYGGEHYVVDLLVGYPLGALGFWAGVRTWPRWRGHLTPLDIKAPDRRATR